MELLFYRHAGNVLVVDVDCDFAESDVEGDRDKFTGSLFDIGDAAGLSESVDLGDVDHPPLAVS